jgi:hypothetical protein
VNSQRAQNICPAHSTHNGSRALRLVPRAKNQHSTENGTHTSGVLNSWKEIAAYLDRGVRTVQRWESNLQLPVHRPQGKNRSAVLAFRDELDDWLRRTPSRLETNETFNRLFEVACSLQNLAHRLASLSDSQTRTEGEKLLEELDTVVRELAQWNGSAWESHSHTSSVEES